MKFKLIHHAEVKDNKLVIKNLDKWRNAIKYLNGKNVRVVLEDDKNARTLPQNRFYWLYLALCESETGTPAEDIHEIAKRKFLLPRFVKFKDEEIKLPATTTKIDPLEFMQYMDKIAMWTGVPIPDKKDVC